MRARKTDDNQRQIVEALRRCGVSVFVTSVLGNGFPDIVAATGGRNYLFEIKDSSKKKSKQKLTPLEELFKEKWRGQVDVITTYEEALKIMDKSK